MKRDMAGIHFDITGENKNFIQALDGAEQGVKETSKVIEQEGGQIEKMFDRLKVAAGGVLAGFTVKEFVQKVAEVRGEFQQLEVAFETMLGSAQKAQSMMADLTQLAATTPFDLQGVASGAKQLLAYGMEAENITDTLRRLGDVAAGLGIQLGDLTYLYGTTMAQGRLYTQDLNQFTGRGIPMIRELANQFGVAESKVKDLVTAGKVGFPEVQKVIESLTNEGGQFGGLMEAQSHTIVGQISNIEDSIDMMFNEIGQQNEGIINGTLSAVSSLVDNYERVGRAITGIIATYGTYKAAVMTVTAIESLRAAGIGALTTAESVHYGWLVLVEKAQKLLNATMLKNPYVLLATAIAAVVTAIVTMKTETERLAEAESKYQEQMQATIDKEKEHKKLLEDLFSVAEDEALSTDTRREALNQLELKYPDIFAKYDTEYEKLKNIKQIKEQIAALDGKSSISNTSVELASVEKRIKELEGMTRTSSKHYQDGYGRWQSRDIQVSTRSKDEEAELQNLYRKRTTLQGKQKKENVNAMFENLTGLSNETLEAEIKRRENLLARMKVQNKDYGTIIGGYSPIRGTYSREDLQYQLNKLNSERNNRNVQTDSSADWAKSVTETYQKAVKAYNDFISDTSNSLSREDYETKAKELKEAADAAKKEYDKVQPMSDKVQKQQEKQSKTAEKRAEASQKIAQLLKDVEIQNQEDTLSIMEDGSKKQLATIDKDYQERKNKILKQANDFAKENKKAGVSGNASLAIDDMTIQGLTQAQKDALSESLAINEQSRQKQVSEVYQEELSAMWDFLAKYGTFEQQRLSIAETYAAQIKQAQESGNEWGVKSLERERDQKLASVSSQSLAANIDWSQTFAGVGNVLSEIGRETLAKIQDYMQTDEFKGLSADQKQSYQSFATKLQQEGAGQSTSAFNFGIWKEIAQDVTAYQKSILALSAAQEAHKSAVQDLQDAQEALTTATTDAEKEIAQGTLEAAQSAVDSTALDLTSAEQQKNTANQKLADSTNRATNGIKNFTSYLNEMSGGSLYGFANGITKLVTSLSKGSDGIGKSLSEIGGKVGGIVGAILQILDALGDDPDQFIEDLLNKLGDAVEGIITDLPQIIGTVFEGVGSIVTGVFSGIGSWFTGGGDSDPHLADDVERMTAVNEELTNAIENLSDIMEEGAVSEATETYEQQIAALEAAMANTQEMMYRSLNASSNRHHSSRNEVDDALEDTDTWQRITELLNDSGLFDGVIEKANDFFSLTSEQMAYIATYAPDLYAQIKQLADDGKEDAAQYMDDYIEYYEELNELTEAWQEKMTSTDFDTVRDEFKDLMSDMESTASDFAESFEDIMKDAVMEVMMDDFDERLQEWYERFASYLSNDGTLSASEQENLRQDWEALSEEAIAARDAMYEAMGWSDTYDQDASSGSWESMSEETANELNGRFTAVQIHTSDTAERMLATVNLLTAMSTAQTTQTQILSEIRNLMIYSNGYLEDVVKYSKLTYNQMKSDLSTIITNTKNL